jgi:hypothetical protein
LNKNIGEIIEKLKLKKAKDRREGKYKREAKYRRKEKDGGNYKDGGILKKSKGSLTVELALIMCIIILIIEGTICFGIKMYVDSIQTVKKETLKIDSLKLFKNYQKLIN